MAGPAERFVPKGDPRSRGAEPDDPYTLHATPAPGDPEALLRCLVQEYAGMGWGREEILELFRSPFFPALHGLLRAYSEAGVRERVAAVLGRTGTLRFRAVVARGAGSGGRGAGIDSNRRRRALASGCGAVRRGSHERGRPCRRSITGNWGAR
jgi:hypothetical protein